MNIAKAVIMTMVIALVMIGTTGFAAATYDSNVTLENKDSNWAVINDAYYATVEYNCAGDEFNWSVIGIVMSNTNYSLIYYADYPERFNQWGGDNPGALIGTFTSQTSGALSASGSTELNMHLPCDPDANMNISEHDYSEAPDYYDNAVGAKLWLVPSVDYDAANKKVNKWNPTVWFFETDLITYVDCDECCTFFNTPDTATFYIGDGFNNETIPIMILNATNAGSVDMTLTYNASLVSVSVADGDMDSYFYNVGTGTIRIGAIQAGNAGLNGDFILANVTLTAVGSGTDDFNITVTTYKDATPCGKAMPYDVDDGIYCTFLNGDVNGDGVVDMFDVMYIAKNVLGITGFENMIDHAADVDGSGTVDIADASYLAKYIIGIPGYSPLK